MQVSLLRRNGFYDDDVLYLRLCSVYLIWMIKSEEVVLELLLSARGFMHRG